RFTGHLRQGDARRSAEGRGAGVPEKSPHGGRAGGQAMNRGVGKKLLALIPVLVFVSSLAAVPAEPAGVKVPANQRFVLPNGLTIVLVPKKDVPLIAFSGFVRGGAAAAPAHKACGAALPPGP